MTASEEKCCPATKEAVGDKLHLWDHVALLLTDRAVRKQAASLLLFHLLCKPSKPNACGAKIFGIANFAVELPILVSDICRLQALPTDGTAEAGLVPGLATSHDLLSSVYRLSTSWALL